MYNLRQLIYSLPSIVGLSVHILGAEVAPLETVDRAKVVDRAVWETGRRILIETCEVVALHTRC